MKRKLSGDSLAESAKEGKALKEERLFTEGGFGFDKNGIAVLQKYYSETYDHLVNCGWGFEVQNVTGRKNLLQHQMQFFGELMNCADDASLFDVSETLRTENLLIGDGHLSSTFLHRAVRLCPLVISDDPESISSTNPEYKNAVVKERLQFLINYPFKKVVNDRPDENGQTVEMLLRDKGYDDLADSLVEKLASKASADFDFEAPFESGLSGFTQSGLESLVEYYNLKYSSQRGAINQIFYNHEDEDSMTDAILLMQKMQEGSDADDPLKIMVTYCNEDSPRHSDPIVLTHDKIIFMRDKKHRGSNFFEMARQSLGLKLVNVKSPEQDSSIQGDLESCHLIALGILKDLDFDDLEEIASFKDGYPPLAKSLKYSQSLTYLQEMLTDKSSEDEVKEGVTVEKYYHNNAIESPKDPSKKITRIAVKKERLIEDLLEIYYSPPSNSPSPSEVGQEIYKKRINRKGNNQTP